MTPTAQFAARAAEATQHQQEIAAKDAHIANLEHMVREHRQDRRRWAESLKEQHQRHVIESDALRKVLAAWEIMANERSARLAAVEAERDRLKAALSQATQDLETVGNDYPGSSCWQWCAERASVARAALSGEGTAKP